MAASLSLPLMQSFSMACKINFRAKQLPGVSGKQCSACQEQAYRKDPAQLSPRELRGFNQHSAQGKLQENLMSAIFCCVALNRSRKKEQTNPQ